MARRIHRLHMATRSVAVAGVAVALWILWQAAVVQAAGQSLVVLTTTHDVHLRSGPGRSYESLAIIPAGTTLIPTYRDFASAHTGVSWFQVEYQGMIGWVNAYYVTWTGDHFSLPIYNYTTPPDAPTPEGPDPVPGPDDVWVEPWSTYANIRSGPGYSYPIIGILPEGRIAIVNARWGSSPSLWMRLTFNGQEAWIAWVAVRVTGDVHSLPDLRPYPSSVLAAWAD